MARFQNVTKNMALAAARKGADDAGRRTVAYYTGSRRDGWAWDYLGEEPEHAHRLPSAVLVHPAASMMPATDMLTALWREEGHLRGLLLNLSNQPESPTQKAAFEALRAARRAVQEAIIVLQQKN